MNNLTGFMLSLFLAGVVYAQSEPSKGLPESESGSSGVVGDVPAICNLVETTVADPRWDFAVSSAALRDDARVCAPVCTALQGANGFLLWPPRVALDEDGHTFSRPLLNIVNYVYYSCESDGADQTVRTQYFKRVNNSAGYAFTIGNLATTPVDSIYVRAGTPYRLYNSVGAIVAGTATAPALGPASLMSAWGDAFAQTAGCPNVIPTSIQRFGNINIAETVFETYSIVVGAEPVILDTAWQWSSNQAAMHTDRYRPAYSVEDDAASRRCCCARRICSLRL